MNPRDIGKIDCKASIKARLNSKYSNWTLDDVFFWNITMSYAY